METSDRVPNVGDASFLHPFLPASGGDLQNVVIVVSNGLLYQLDELPLAAITTLQHCKAVLCHLPSHLNLESFKRVSETSIFRLFYNALTVIYNLL